MLGCSHAVGPDNSLGGVVGVARHAFGKSTGDWRLVRRSAVVYSEATWLILPVVICLSQRLSHACLSTCRNKVKPRMAH
jgi:hypothetical protein